MPRQPMVDTRNAQVNGISSPLFFIQIFAGNIILRHLLSADFVACVGGLDARHNFSFERVSFLDQLRPHSPNLHLLCLTIPANLPIAHPTSLSLLRGQRTRYSNFGLCPEPAAWNRPPSSRRLSSCRQPSFSRLSSLLLTSPSLTFS